MAETHNLVSWTAAHPYAQTESPYKINMITAVLDTDVKNIANGDTVNLITIPANSMVTVVRVAVLTAEGGALTLDIGDGDNAALYHSNVDANALTEAVSAFSAAKYYSTADTIDAHLDGAADACKIQVQAVLIDFN